MEIEKWDEQTRTSHQGVGENEKEWDEQMRTSHQGVGENEINWDERRAQTSTEADERFWPKMPVLNISLKFSLAKNSS